ncbi:MAG: RuBisCO large subunit C-terminal-like domain-containing protein [Alphaproteobacteria bacterium]
MDIQVYAPESRGTVPPQERLTAVYRIRTTSRDVEARAKAIALEQSIEMPDDDVTDPYVRDAVIGQVAEIRPLASDLFEVRILLAVSTTGLEAGQFMNMLFGNTSIHEDVQLADIAVPASVANAFGGPNHGLAGLRRRAGAATRALTCSAIKPQGLAAPALAAIARRFAEGGIDFVKDDHGLADQAYSPFAERVRACADAVAEANAVRGGNTRYVPSLSGNLDRLRRQVELAVENGIDTVLIAPMVVGLPALHALAREYPQLALMAHPALAGALRIAPPLLLGKLFRLFGADATIFPNHGGRFGYTPETCRDLACAARDPWHGLAACAPVPAGGMTTERVGEMLGFYGTDTILLIGGNLLAAGDALAGKTAEFAASVAAFPEKRDV